MTAMNLGRAGLQGWRAKVADAAGPAVARRTSFSEDQVRATIGVVFFVLAALYVAKTLQQWLGPSR
jgi:hypothetical protein